MDLKNYSYSPYILIYLEIGDKKIQLSDVLYTSAMLSEKVEIPPQTHASLVFSIDGDEEREEIIIDEGISTYDSRISFSYANHNRLNGRDLNILQ